MALTWALCAAPGRRRRPLPCWASPLPPDHGGWHDRRPSGGQDARLLLQLQPPPLDRQTPLSPPQHPGMPFVVAAAAMPHPPVPFA